MKKSLVALAVLAASGAAMAQSSVTLWGVVDAAVSRASQNGVSKTYMTTSGNTSSQLGFRGTEDLGGGMSASFWLEAGLLNDTGAGATAGALAFNRRSTMDLASGKVALRLGRDYTPSFWNHTVFDPFGTLGAGAGSNITLGAGSNGAAGANPATAARSNNSITMLYNVAANGGSHALGSTGVYGSLMYALHENASSANTNVGKYTGGRVGYAMGPLNAAVSYAVSQGANGAVVNSQYKEFNLAGSYDLGVAKAVAHFGTNNSDVASTKHTHWGVGATFPVGAGAIPVSYNRVKQNNAASTGADQLAIGYVYNLSKRTAVYTTYSRIGNKNGGNYTFLGGNGGGNPGLAAGGANGSAFDLGLKHSF